MAEMHSNWGRWVRCGAGPLEQVQCNDACYQHAGSAMRSPHATLKLQEDSRHAGPDLPRVVPPPDPNVLPPIAMTDFQPYLAKCAASHARFEAARRSRAAEEASSPMAAATFGGGRAGPAGRIMPGEGLVEAMRTVPAMFFNEDFSLTRCGGDSVCTGPPSSCRPGTCAPLCDVAQAVMFGALAGLRRGARC